MFRGEDFSHSQGGEEILKVGTADVAVEVAHDQEAISSHLPLAAGGL